MEAAVAAAHSPDAVTAALSQIDDLKSRIKGRLAAKLGRMEDQLKNNGTAAASTPEPSATPPPAPAAQATPPPGTPAPAAPDPQAVKADQASLAAAKQKYAAACAAFRFDDAQTAAQTAVVVTPDGLQAKQALLKKAYWLRQFKALLIQDINAYSYPEPMTTRTSGQMPDGPKKADDDSVLAQTQFGSIPFPWTDVSSAQILEMAIYYQKTTATTAPQQAAEREWLAGVYACEDGLAQNGQPLLNQAAQANPTYKDDLALFPQTQ